MSRLPRITLVTPSYQQAAFLEDTLLSVFAQDYPDLEYFVLDGGSTDGSVEIIRRHAAKITWWCSEKDEGQAAALRRGFAMATGEILCWLNSDDIFCPGALRTAGEYFAAHPEEECANGGSYFIDERGNPLRFGIVGFTKGLRQTPGRMKWLGQKALAQPSCFFRKAAYEAVGGVDPGLRFCMDRDLFVRLAERRPIARIDAFLSAGRIHGAAKTVAIGDVCAAENRLLDARYGVARAPAWKRRLMWLRYRVPDLAVKAGWMAQWRLGLLPIRPLRYVREG